MAEDSLNERNPALRTLADRLIAEDLINLTDPALLILADPVIDQCDEKAVVIMKMALYSALLRRMKEDLDNVLYVVDDPGVVDVAPVVMVRILGAQVAEHNVALFVKNFKRIIAKFFWTVCTFKI
jgi:hypothetical protein